MPLRTDILTLPYSAVERLYSNGQLESADFARDARDAAQREYDKAWAVCSELDDANEADEADDDAEDRHIGGTR